MIDIKRYSPPTRSVTPDEFIGREAEVALLKARIIDERKRNTLVTGDYRAGKTSLVTYFSDRYRDAFDGKTEFFNLDISGQRFPELKKDTKLVIFDDLENDDYPEISGRLLSFIDQNPDRQYLATSRKSDPLLNRHIDYELPLQSFSSDNTLQLLIQQLESRFP